MEFSNHWRITVADLGDSDNDIDRSIAPDIQKTLTRTGIKASVDQDEMDYDESIQKNLTNELAEQWQQRKQG